ncbi:colicin V processing peptidase [Paraburkholderia eburnea]|uniref:Cyclolysin secretion/processing ATP-binding protein CyaB n=1 Tax=Paraburkholderia eburnea TaxID=1189126 RepID=A0A2S4M8I9_9BURK|nr:peptidase domain-containing ABC transporter [Paraburkholderia eburnea]POR51058.1 colicin V processing peptidase [Paraburkholderia eburnea]PRZ21793.1 colicin V processing peptidase [Paraburkholderia eburnea]
MNPFANLQFGFKRKLVPVLQTEAAECGLACLVMVAATHGHHTDLRSLRTRHSVSLKGTTLRQLMEVARALGMSSRPLRLEVNELKGLQLPCILHWDLSHFVVLSAVTHQSVVIYDPAMGRRVLSLDEFSKAFTGVALELTPDFDFRKQRPVRSLKLRTLTGRIIGLRQSLTQVFLLALAIEVFSLMAPFFNEWIVDDAIVGGDVGLVTTLSVGFGLLWLVQTLVELARAWAVTYMSTSLNVQWLARTFSHLVRLPISFFERRHLADILTRASSVNTIQATLTTSFVEAILDGLMSLGTLSMMLFFNARLTSITVIALTLYIALRICLYTALQLATESQFVFDAKQQSHLIETIRGIQSVRLYNKGMSRLSAWLNLIVRQKNAALRTQRLMIVFHTCNSAIFRAEKLLVFAFGAVAVIDKQVTLGMLLAFLAYRDQFSQRATSLVDKAYELKILGIQTRRLADILLETPEDESLGEMPGVVNANGHLELRNVVYRYSSTEKPVISAASLSIRDGEHLAITGLSGCGKSTLLKIMTGLLKPSSGAVTVGGISIRQVGLEKYRSMFGAVMQDDQLFAGTIAENISFFDDRPDLEQIKACARNASVLKDILSMPMGFHTLVGDMGSSLSGGQKQRILLARALYKKPRILFLDEATSHLDANNERIVSDAIKKLKITRVVIAHRAETINAADRVLRMERTAGGSTIFTDITPRSADEQPLRGVGIGEAS